MILRTVLNVTELLQFSPMIIKISLLNYFYSPVLLCKARPACSSEVDLEIYLYFKKFVIFKIFVQVLKVTVHLELSQNVGYISRVVDRLHFCSLSYTQ